LKINFNSIPTSSNLSSHLTNSHSDCGGVCDDHDDHESIQYNIRILITW